MAFPSYESRAAQKRPSSRYGGPVFGVGRQAFVSAADGSVTLLDEKAKAVVGALDDGAEVEILGWIPRGAATRYQVRSTKGLVVGWLGAAELRATRTLAVPGSPAAPSVPVSIPLQNPAASGREEGPKRRARTKTPRESLV
jgi:hypothetical protein